MQKEETTEETYCSQCGARMKSYWHAITPGLVKMLVKIYSAIASKGENKIHPHKEMELTTTEHMNMTKLRFHGLIAKCKEEGEVQRGFWLITHRGVEFLKGEIQIPSRVQTFRDKVTGHDERLVTVTDVMKSTPYWEKDFSYEIFEPKQTSML
jgi:hypothetical protein